MWLLWPVIMFIIHVFDIQGEIRWIWKMLTGKLDKSTFRSLLKWYSTNIRVSITGYFVAFGYSTSVFVWYYRYSSDTSLYWYLEATAMVFLFGWFLTIIIFTGIMQRFSVFTMVLKEIIIKDIMLNFLPVFLFTLLAFSFALHVLGLYTPVSDDVVHLGATVYDLFAASLGSGDYIQTWREERSRAGIHFGLFDVVVICYVCVTVIILLNVLIAMMNHRYDRAKQHVSEDFWRLQMIRIALSVESLPGIRQMMEAFYSAKKNLKQCAICCYQSGAAIDDKMPKAEDRNFIVVKFVREAHR